MRRKDVGWFGGGCWGEVFFAWKILSSNSTYLYFPQVLHPRKMRYYYVRCHLPYHIQERARMVRFFFKKKYDFMTWIIMNNYSCHSSKYTQLNEISSIISSPKKTPTSPPKNLLPGIRILSVYVKQSRLSSLVTRLMSKIGRSKLETFNSTERETFSITIYLRDLTLTSKNRSYGRIRV